MFHQKINTEKLVSIIEINHQNLMGGWDEKNAHKVDRVFINY